MYHLEYLFSLDLAPVKIKTQMQPMHLPYPVIQNAVQQTLIITVPEIPDEAGTDKLIQTYQDTVTGTELADYTVEKVRYLGLSKVVRVNDDASTQQKGES